VSKSKTKKKRIGRALVAVVEALFATMEWGLRNVVAVVMLSLAFTVLWWNAAAIFGSAKPIIPEVSETTAAFTAKAVMVEYGNSWFGLGGISSTTLLFQKGDSLIEFKFNEQLDVTTGKAYTVTYNITTTTYFNITGLERSAFPFVYKTHINSTKIQPICVVESYDTK